MEDVITKEELANYKITGQVAIKDNQGEVQGYYPVGAVYTFTKEVGDAYVAEGIAELTEEVSGGEAEEIAEAPAPEAEAPVAETPDAPVENTDVPTQAEENATIGLDEATLEKGAYKITGEVALFGDIQEIGSIVEIEKNLGDKLVEDGLAEKVEGIL